MAKVGARTRLGAADELGGRRDVRRSMAGGHHSDSQCWNHRCVIYQWPARRRRSARVTCNELPAMQVVGELTMAFKGSARGRQRDPFKPWTGPLKSWSSSLITTKCLMVLTSMTLSAGAVAANAARVCAALMVDRSRRQIYTIPQSRRARNRCAEAARELETVLYRTGPHGDQGWIWGCSGGP